MNTPKSACKAKNPEFCRYHSSNSGVYNSRAESAYNYYKEAVKTSKTLDDRYHNEDALKEAEVEYASTDEGRQVFAQQHDESDDAMEKERLKTLIEDGERLRDYIEDKADGIVRFPASKLEIAEKRIESANRKLARAGLEERFTYTTEEYVETDKEGHAFNMIALSISHPKLNVGGWDFVAAVDKTDDGSTITRTLPSQELNGYRPEQFQCDHCGSNRRRNSTYLLRNQEGEYKQVGSNCLQSFLGVKPSGLWMLDYDPEANGDYIRRSGGGGWGGSDSAIPTTELVAAALAVSEGGEKYVSNKVASEWGITSTVTDVKDYFFSRSAKKKWENVDHHEYVQEARQMMDATTFDGDDDYNTNMRTLLNQEYTSIKHMGYVASVIAAHKRQTGAFERAAEKAAKPKAVGYLGKPDEKIKNVKLKVTKKHVSEFFYNGYERTSTLFIMEDDLGRQVKWSASGTKDFQEGDEIMISSATIKDTDTYNENEQTIITRARATKVEPETTGAG
jgi:hypothetical protein